MGGAVIARVMPGSTAEELGIVPGSRVLSVNGRKIRDVIDFRFEVSGEEALLEVSDSSGEVTVYELEKEYDDLLGIDFEEDVFDSLRQCENACPFCFVKNLPEGLRGSLYIRDDDYRLSFLYGNFITLTNLKRPDVLRIIRQRLSPLYVSVHTTNGELRKKMLNNSRAKSLMSTLGELAHSGISFHFQIVLCPGYNDGPELARSLADLAAFGEAALSVGVVPVGLTRYCKAPGIRLVRRDEAEETLEIIDNFRLQSGFRRVYASDELFVIAGRDIPDEGYYDDYPQLENGIGLARSFLDEVPSVPSAQNQICHKKRVGVATATSFAPFMRQFLMRYDKVTGLDIALKIVENKFFGSTVTVAGLMTGKDILETFAGETGLTELLIPETCLHNGLFLDGMALTDLASGLGTVVLPVSVSPLALHERIVS